MYITFSFIKFKDNLRNKLGSLAEIFESLLFFVVYWQVFKSLYGKETQVDGYTLEMVITNILFIVCMSRAYANQEIFIHKKLKEGALPTELMKPVDYPARALFESIGNVIFNICFRAIPVVFIALLLTEIRKPANVWRLLLFLCSSVIGYLIYWYLDFILNELAFFDLSAWAFITIKNGIIDIFGGMLLPIWFMMPIIRQILYITPIPYIYQIPVNIYLGMYSAKKLTGLFVIQLIWAAVMLVLSRGIWRKGIEKILKKGAG